MRSNGAFGIVATLAIVSSIGMICVPAQGPLPVNRSSRTVVGLARTVTRDGVTVASGERILKLHIDRSSQIWKGKLVSRELGVRPGDAVVARCAASPSGELHVTSMWVNTVAIFGKIVTAGLGRFSFLTNHNADPASAYKKEIKVVRFDADTVFDSSAPADLLPGRQVEVVGVSVDAHTIQATTIVVYEGKRPTRMQTDVTIEPDGHPQPRVKQR